MWFVMYWLVVLCIAWGWLVASWVWNGGVLFGFVEWCIVMLFDFSWVCLFRFFVFVMVWVAIALWWVGNGLRGSSVLMLAGVGLGGFVGLRRLRGMRLGLGWLTWLACWAGFWFRALVCVLW